MISIVAKFTINKETETTFLKLVNELGETSRAEEGCIEYILHKDMTNPFIFCLIEKWKDQEAVDFHNNTPHFTSIVPKIAEMAQVEISVFETL